MDEFEFEGAGEAFVESVGRLEAAGMGFLGIKFGCRAEFLYSDGGDCEFFTCDFGEKIETVASHHAEPIGKMGRWDMLFENLAYVGDELVHIVVRLIYVVEDIVALGHVVDHILHEGHDVTNVCH